MFFRFVCGRAHDDCTVVSCDARHKDLMKNDMRSAQIMSRA